MKLIFIRHGEPDYSVDSLTEKGFREAELLGHRASAWDVDKIYISPLGRAQATAAPILKALNQKGETLPWLQEFSGRILPQEGSKGDIPWDFRPSFWTRFDSLYDEKNWYREAPMLPPEAGRSVEEVYLETAQGLDRILKQYGYHRDERVYRVIRHSNATVVFVCHLGITCAMLSHLLGIPFVPMVQGFFLPPSSVTIVGSEEVEEGYAGFRCQCLGDTRHLQKGNEPISHMGYFDTVFQG